MRLDFWNNPLVVTAVRVSNRRRSPRLLMSIYFLLLFSVFLIFRHYHDEFLPVPWEQAYLVALMGFQGILLSLIAVVCTGANLIVEVSKRTLDFQRIVTLRPSEILVGKLLGIPMLVYLAMMASIPIAVLCWILGAVSLPILILLYLNLATTVLMFAAIGLLHPLHPPEEKSGGASPAGSYGVAVGIILIILIVQASILIVIPLARTRGISILDILGGSDALAYGFPFFGWEIPYLVFTPLAQLAIVLLVLRVMSNRLAKPLDTFFEKPTAYIVLFLVDVFAAGAFYDPSILGYLPIARAPFFCAVHLIVGLLLTLLITPRRETLKSWIWETHNRSPKFRDLWLGQRGPIDFAVVTLIIMGIVSLLGLLVLPASVSAGKLPDSETLRTTGAAILLMVLLLAAIGYLFQYFVLISKYGVLMFLLLVFLLAWIPFAWGVFFRKEFLNSLSPIHHFVFLSGQRLSMFSPNTLSLWPIIIFYGVIFLGSRLWLRNWIRYNERVVDRKLKEMGVGGTT